MGYKTILNNNVGEGQNGWQLRVAIDPQALNEGNPAINELDKILKKHFKDKTVGVKYYTIRDEDEHLNSYDGMTSKLGSDRTQHGKEVCIYFDDTHEIQYSAKEIKQTLLSLWADLQNAEIPLLYIDVPGDKKITGPYEYPTPFSFTCNNSKVNINGVDTDEWNLPHGILHKTFKGDGTNHPLLNVRFNQKDLDNAGINFNLDRIALQRKAEDQAHQLKVEQTITRDLNAIDRSPTNYVDFLSDQSVIEGIWNKIENYQTKVKTLDKTSRGAYQVQFSDEMEKDNDFRKLIDGYPCKPDKDFRYEDDIGKLNQNYKALDREQFDGIIADLRANYPARLAVVKADFPETDHHRIDNNPALMQTIYRRMELSKQEKTFIQKFEQTCLNKPKIEQTIEKAMQGIEKYQARPRGFSSHLGLFAWMFDSERGLNRSHIYLNILKNPTISEKDKIKTLFALFDSKDGPTLQKDVAEAVFGSEKSLTDARAEIRQLTAEVYDFKSDGPLPESFDKSIDQVISITNEAEDPEAFRYKGR